MLPGSMSEIQNLRSCAAGGITGGCATFSRCTHVRHTHEYRHGGTAERNGYSHLALRRSNRYDWCATGCLSARTYPHGKSLGGGTTLPGGNPEHQGHSRSPDLSKHLSI